MKTTKYKYFNYPFKEFNPVQEEVFPYIEKDSNVIICSPTSSGKTVAGELIAGKALSEETRVLYLTPLKALASERVKDWRDSKHPWSDYDIFEMTGDYQLTPQRSKELSHSLIIVSTYEMLAVRARKRNKEDSEWLDQIGVLIVDEAHFIDSEGRGDHLENALVAFTKRSPNTRLVFLSATLRNNEEISSWLKLLNGKDTSIIDTDYRPCELNVHYVEYEHPYGISYMQYQASEERKINCTLETIAEYPNDQWLIFVHAKSTGNRILSSLRDIYSDKLSAFHNADLDRQRRETIETNFKKRKIRFLVATSTLAYGLNLPARRVIVVGVNRGMHTVSPMDIIQEFGRAGRPKYDTEGDAYLVVSDKNRSVWEELITKGVDVKSRLKEALGFHLIGEIVAKRVHTPEDAEEWAERTLMFCQGDWSMENAVSVFRLFAANSLIESKKDDWALESETYYKATRLGIIAAYNYFDPLLVADWKRNMQYIQERDLWHRDAAICWMISNSLANSGYCPKPLFAFTDEYLAAAKAIKLRVVNDHSLAIGTVYYHLINDKADDPAFFSMKMGIINDVDRVITCMSQIQERLLGRASGDFWERFRLRVKYQVSWEESEFCTLPGIGRAYSKRLLEAGISFKTFMRRYSKKIAAVVSEDLYYKATGKKNIVSKKKKSVKKSDKKSVGIDWGTL